jgi:ribosomal protein S18 acetylase RimI-like enzyme
VAGGDWDGIADSLLATLEGALPTAVRQMDLAGDTRHAHLERFAKRHEFAFFKEARVMNLERTRFTGSAPPDVVPLRPSLTGSLATVHDAAFPETYFRGDQLGSLDPAEYPILVTESGGRVSGYAMLEPDREGGSAFLHFVAVAEAARGTGLGRKLLDAALTRAFADPAVKVLSLTVEATNTTAIAWYERRGFATERSVIAYRKER